MLFLLGEAAPPSAGSSSGGITTISSGSLPAATTQSFTGIAATYAYLALYVSGASSNTATRHPMVVFGTGAGPTYDTTTASYSTKSVGGASPGAWGPALEASAIASNASDTAPGPTDQAANITWTFSLYIYGYQGGPNARYTTYLKDSSGVDLVFVDGFFVGSVAAITAIQIKWNGSGNFDAGTFALYGIS